MSRIEAESSSVRSLIPRRAAVIKTVSPSGNTAFGFELYGQLKDEAGNLFLSPFNISTALGMAAAGAKGKTFEEMEKVLHLPANYPAAFGSVLCFAAISAKLASVTCARTASAARRTLSFWTGVIVGLVPNRMWRAA